MAEQTISPRAGVACMTCDNPDPCIYKISVTFGQNTQVWPEKPAIKMDLIDHGKGQKGTIQIEDKCNNVAKHHAVLTGGKKEETIAFNTPQEVTLFYKDKSEDTEIEKGLESVWSYLSNLANPTDMYSDPHYYQLMAQGCIHSQKYATIAVYPSVSFMVSVGLSFDFSHGERAVKERRDEQKKARQAMENVKPKNGNKLRSGWTTQTDPFYLTRQTALNVEYALTVQDIDYSAKFAEVNKVRQTRRVLNSINMMGGVDLAGYHDGIVAEIVVAAEAKKNKSNSKNIVKAKKKWKWVIADPLKANESPLRINLIGEERPVTRPEIVPGSEIIPWEKGYNPKPKLDNIPFITGFPGM
ncbi:hypothetical protein ACSLVK_20630 [Photorhabdus tasmaniensis]|uniref:hypothetical protein n=1 Tax=Photorhabdus tasmaniensis TaxID=1004159 RepID=UPI004042C8EB